MLDTHIQGKGNFYMPSNTGNIIKYSTKLKKHNIYDYNGLALIVVSVLLFVNDIDENIRCMRFVNIQQVA